jgi:hypothetical protein
MTTLRVLVAAAQALDRPVPWALFDASGRVVDRGTGSRSSWPAAARTEAVVAASAVRIATTELPPLAPSRVAAAAAFSLEDRLAGPPESHHVATSAQAAGGRVRAVIVSRADIAALARASFARVVAEPDLAPIEPSWHWCTAGERGFVRLADGAAFPVDEQPSGALPVELAHAIERARRDNVLPPSIVADRAAADEHLAQWSRDTGVAFARGTPWRWHDAPPERFAAAIDLLQGAFAASPSDPPARLMSRVLAPAVALVAAAAAVHTVAALGDWTMTRIDAWRQAHAWTALAREAGAAESEARDASTAKAAIARRHADARHAHGLLAPSDALPLLARASAAFDRLPPGALRAAAYADGHWTFELVRVDAATLARLDAALRSAGTPAVAATSESGTRLRVGAP